MSIVPWSDDRSESLKKLFEAGLSASQIAAELGGGLTRNAVLGKIHRLGLSKPRTRREPLPRSPRPRAPQYLRQNSTPSYRGTAVPAIAMKADPERAPVAEIIPIHQRVALLELTDAVCHWPVGDPLAADFHFCGGRVVTGMSYCGHHCRMAYVLPSEPRSRRNGKRPGRSLYGWA